jgi:hypothetical protein
MERSRSLTVAPKLLDGASADIRPLSQRVQARRFILTGRAELYVVKLGGSASYYVDSAVRCGLMAGRQGLEPRYADPESAVLPLDDLPRILSGSITTVCAMNATALNSV